MVLELTAEMMVQLMAVLYALLVVRPGSRPLQITAGFLPFVRPDLAVPCVLAMAWCWLRTRRIPWPLVATTAAVKHRLDVAQFICCQMVNRDMTEEQMRPELERVLQGQDLYGNTVMHYFALRANAALSIMTICTTSSPERMGGSTCRRRR